MEITKDFIDEMAEGAIVLTGFDDCIVGITEEFGNENRILYSVSKIIQSLVKDGMTEEDALEYYSFNIIGGYFGEQNPIFLVDYLEY
jgi:hypothetical protein|tara:strand:- start:255 stop:515 length:261 start_codon:yes stop_codon:yes gene_type:complete